MAAPTFAQLLDEAKTVYQAILTGKVSSATLQGTVFTYHNLDSLRRHVEWLERMAAGEAGSRRPAVATFGSL